MGIREKLVDSMIKIGLEQIGDIADAQKKDLKRVSDVEAIRGSHIKILNKIIESSKNAKIKRIEKEHIIHLRKILSIVAKKQAKMAEMIKQEENLYKINFKELIVFLVKKMNIIDGQEWFYAMHYENSLHQNYMVTSKTSDNITDSTVKLYRVEQFPVVLFVKKRWAQDITEVINNTNAKYENFRQGGVFKDFYEHEIPKDLNSDELIAMKNSLCNSGDMYYFYLKTYECLDSLLSPEEKEREVDEIAVIDFLASKYGIETDVEKYVEQLKSEQGKETAGKAPKSKMPKGKK